LHEVYEPGQKPFRRPAVMVAVNRANVRLSSALNRISPRSCLIDSKPSFVAKVLRSAISLSDSLPVLNAIAVVIAVRQEPAVTVACCQAIDQLLLNNLHRCFNQVLGQMCAVVKHRARPLSDKGRCTVLVLLREVH